MSQIVIYFLHSIAVIDVVSTFFIQNLRNALYSKTSNISVTLEGNKIVDHSDVVGASPVGAAPTTSSFST